jgi:hypothetical protein
MPLRTRHISFPDLHIFSSTHGDIVRSPVDLTAHLRPEPPQALDSHSSRFERDPRKGNGRLHIDASASSTTSLPTLIDEDNVPSLDDRRNGLAELNGHP